MALGDAVSMALDRVIETYLGGDGPQEMPWSKRFSNAFLGAVVFASGGFLMTFMALESRRLGHLENSSNALSGIKQILQDRASSGGVLSDNEYSAFRALVDIIESVAGAPAPFETLGSILNLVLISTTFSLCAAVAATIAGSIRRGGPLRLFLLGVTVPALVFFLVGRAFPVDAWLEHFVQ